MLTKYRGANTDSGFLFLLNAPVLIFWTLVSYRDPTKMVSAGRLAIFTQVAISVVMLIRKMIIPGIRTNAVIIFAFIVVTLLCSRWLQHKWPFPSPQDA